MKLSDRTVPISDLIADADELIQSLGEHRPPVVITVDGQRKAVLQDFDSYYQTQETIAMLKIIAMGQADIREGNVLPVDEAFRRLREKVRKDSAPAGALAALHPFRDSRNTACSPSRFQTAQGRLKRTGVPLPLRAAAWSMRAPISSTSATKSRMVQKWIFGVSCQL